MPGGSPTSKPSLIPSTSTMSAYTHTVRGLPTSTLSLNPSYPVPSFQTPTSALVRITHCAFNPGTIISLGSSVSASRTLTSGTPVFGSIPVGFRLKIGAGVLAEYVAVESDCVVRTLEGKRGEEVAGLPVAGCTALLLAEKAGLKRGDSVIDYTAYSPVSTYLAKCFSATPFSAIFDAYRIQDIFTHCESYLGEGKPFVTVGVAIKDYAISGVLSAGFQMMSNSLWPRMLGGVNRSYVQVTAIANLDAMTKLAGLVESGKLRVVRDGEGGMGDALKAYERLLSRRAKGKIVVKIQDE